MPRTANFDNPTSCRLAGGGMGANAGSVPAASSEAAKGNEAHDRDQDAEPEAPDDRHNDSGDYKDSAEADPCTAPCPAVSHRSSSHVFLRTLRCIQVGGHATRP